MALKMSRAQGPAKASFRDKVRRLLADDGDLHTPVLLAPRCRTVIRQRHGFAMSDRLHTGRIDAHRCKRDTDRLRPTFR